MDKRVRRVEVKTSKIVLVTHVVNIKIKYMNKLYDCLSLFLVLALFFCIFNFFEIHGEKGLHPL